MIGFNMGYTLISPEFPRISVTMRWGIDAPQGAIQLYMKRVGDAAEFAAYAPLNINGSVLTFQFDDLLFSQKQGRFEGRLVIGVDTIATLHFEYKDTTFVAGVQNV